MRESQTCLPVPHLEALELPIAVGTDNMQRPHAAMTFNVTVSLLT